MSRPSNWPLPKGSSRLMLPQPLLAELKTNPLSQDLYPISYGHYLNAKGHRVRRHVHTDHLIIFCHAGLGRYRAGALKGQLSAGEVLFLRKGVSHVYQADTTQPWSIYWAHFEGGLVENYMDFIGVSDVNPVLKLSNWRALLSNVTQLLNLQHERLNIEKGLFASALLKKLLLELPLVAQKKQHDAKKFEFSAIEQFMRDNSHKALELDELAEFSGLSRYYFSKKFKQATGQSPLNYFTEMKMKQAAMMLAHEAQTIRQISQTLGYDDPYYFSRLFKKYYQLAPHYYRQKTKKT